MDTPDQLSFFDLTHHCDALTLKGDPLEQLTQHSPGSRIRRTQERSLGRSKRQKEAARRLMPYSFNPGAESSL